MERSEEYGSAFGWFVCGTVAGACVALLFAPATGKKTRERLSRRFRDTKESVTEFTAGVADATREIVDKAERLGDKTVRMAGEASAAMRDAMGNLASQTERFTKHS